MRLKGKHTAIFGLKGEGKSNFLQYTLTRPEYASHLVYDVTKEHEPLHRYIPKYRRGDDAKDELNEVVRRLVTGNDEDRRPDLLAIEEMSRFSSTNVQPPDEVYELIDMNRHYGVGIIFVARRPAQVHPDVFELADNVVSFHLQGPNDIRKLNNYRDGMGDAVKALPKHHYIVSQGRDYAEHSPVEEMDTTGSM